MQPSRFWQPRELLGMKIRKAGKEQVMKRKWIAAAAIAALFTAGAWAQMGPGWGGYGGYGMGPGMMGGYGYGMGPGMMGGYGMGPGMMGGYGRGGYGYGALNLSEEQRTKIAAIEEEVAKRQWELMDKMHDQHYDLWRGDESASRKAYEVMSSARKAMFENSLEARKRIDSVLTSEQREQLRRGWRGR
jgi:Spy/CpxP family protein refolding chaperone